MADTVVEVRDDAETEATAESVAIRARGVTKRFGETTAVDDVSFSVAPGGIAAFLGPNGSGKTTLVRLLTGVIAPSSGTVELLGYDVADAALDAQAHVGVVTESISLYERFSGRYNLRFYGRLYDVSGETLQRRIGELADVLGFESYLDDPVESYSTGMKKRLLLARALLHDPDVLFLDEPTNGLDPQASQVVVEHIDAIRRDRDVTVFLCTHNLQVAERLATDLFFLDEGSIVASGTPADLRADLWPEVTVAATVGDWSDALTRRVETASWAAGSVDVTASMDVPDAHVVRVDLASREAIPDLVETLVDGDARLYELEEADYSLEDIYFRVRGDLQ
jgi:ABC-2 type transport system ATP-binding protein